MVSGSLRAQVSPMVLYNNDTTYFCTTTWYENFDLTLYTELDAFDSWGIITGVDPTFHLLVDYFCSGVNGYLTIWDGNTQIVDQHLQGSLSQVYPISSGQITFHVHFDAIQANQALIAQRHLNMFWSSSNFTYSSENPCSPTFLTSVENITTTEADITWSPANATMHITVDDQHYTSTGGALHLSGLAPNSYHHVKVMPNIPNASPCCTSIRDFYTKPVPRLGCPNALDLYSDYVQCFYGNLLHPIFNIGIMDGGPANSYSRHTVHTNPDETDPLTNNMLHTVCPGAPGSVRLGNWHTGAESESIEYHLHVDTTLYSLIMLHYAAVLQNPNHNAEEQPRFTMRILDQNDSVIDPQCGVADFIADASLGWNTYGDDILWKDWTTIGINLAPYHGQDVRLQLTTFDCGEGGHFGYAYFYVECQQPYATSDHCGTVDTATLTAPDGFNYLWYYNNETQHPISTERTATVVTSEGPVHCRLSFIENPSCYLTMNTNVLNFWPLAVIDTLFTQNNGCDGFVVQFHNCSTILDDDSIPLVGTPPCESALWRFGDGFISTAYHPTHTYRRPGTYTVTLISGLAGGQCFDTATYTIVAPDVWVDKDIFLSCCDSLMWIDSMWYDHDTVGPTFRVAYPESCDTIYYLHLSTLPTSHYYMPTDTFCHNSSYAWRGDSAPISHSTDTLYLLLTSTEHLTAANGCDSLVHLPLVQLPPDPLDIIIHPDCGLGFYTLTAVTDKPFWLWSSSPQDPDLDGHETDRQVWVFPDSTVNYTLTSYYDSSLFCPTTIVRSLSRPTFPHGELEVNPEVLSVDNHTLLAYDKSDKHNSRHWAVIPYGPGDTITLTDTLRRISYTASPFDDSITVLLAVSNTFCNDTVSRTIPIIRSASFAPNVFTPDADINNRFTIVYNGILEAELTVYNRQGLLVFSTTDLENGWDGTHNGAPCPQGAYVWHLRFRSAEKPKQWQSCIGTVTLLR